MITSIDNLPRAGLPHWEAGTNSFHVAGDQLVVERSRDGEHGCDDDDDNLCAGERWRSNR